MPDSLPRLLLASTSPYRREQLHKLGLSFDCRPPLFDEDEFKKKMSDPEQLAAILAFKKAESLKAPGVCVIGGDQLVSFEGKILGKPKTKENAFFQLSQMQGKQHHLVTALCVILDETTFPILNITKIKMRNLNSTQIENYLLLDQPYDCAGSYKIENSGLTLIETIETSDFSAIQGLPLLELIRVLGQIGFVIPGKITK